MKVSAEGAVLRIGIKFSSEEWLAYQKKAAGMSPKALFEPHESNVTISASIQADRSHATCPHPERLCHNRALDRSTPTWT